ncbi:MULTISPECIES: glycerol kinase GlpK [Sphingobacterium]|uniref:Glycerol kinase n=1 Tax=Sphingobacterium populi TaxID=1812824 RepID=A0ABW5UAI6_9SPHI|nr:glycerol kinase GlpK [Sphingobacterium sp. CFCC 11742]
MNPYILSIDQGTTSSRALLVDQEGQIRAIAQKEFTQYYPKAGWVEHDPMEIWFSQREVITAVLKKAGIKSTAIHAIGITNQRETTIIWDRSTGTPIYPAIVWQDRRSSDLCDALKAQGHEEMVRQKTGLLIDAYFSATKIKWILDNVKDARSKAKSGQLAFGTVDSWLVWNLTSGKEHLTDATNASRTMLYNIHTHAWDLELLDLFDIPLELLPSVKSSSEIYAETSIKAINNSIPIAGIAGDQQSALFGQLCIQPGMVKNTYGTGCFMLLNTGREAILSNHKLVTTIAWQIGKEVTYALEGSVFIGGAVVQWLRDGLGLIEQSEDICPLAEQVDTTDGVYIVPAFAGLGAPHWHSHARGAIFGITRGTTDAHIARACLESIAFQTYDVLEAMQQDAKTKITELRVDGGATANDLLLSFQANLLQVDVVRPTNTETTAMGAAYLAGLASGFWRDVSELQALHAADRTFRPEDNSSSTAAQLSDWHIAVEASKIWSSLKTKLK